MENVDVLPSTKSKEPSSCDLPVCVCVHAYLGDVAGSPHVGTNQIALADSGRNHHDFFRIGQLIAGGVPMRFREARDLPASWVEGQPLTL